MSISQQEVDWMAAEAEKWWNEIGAYDKMQRTGATDDKEAIRRFYALNISDRWHLSRGDFKTVAGFNWIQKGE